MTDAKKLRDDELVVRYVGGMHVDENTGIINGSAFDRTDKDIDGLSVTRRYVFHPSDDKDVNEIRRVVGTWINFGATAIFAQAEVRQLKAAGRLAEIALELIEDAVGAFQTRLANPAHGLILGLPIISEALGSARNEALNDRLVAAISEYFPAKLSR